MDEALAADAVEFASKLSAVQKLTGNLTDSGHALPFTGLVKAAEKDPGTVQEMFRALYALCDYYGIYLDHHHAASDSRAAAEIMMQYMDSGANVKSFVRTYSFER